MACNTVIVKQDTVNKLPHTTGELIIDKEPTCISRGIAHTECTVCGTIIYSSNLAFAPHNEIIDPAVEATCTTEGITEGKHCSVCNQVLFPQKVVPANGHTESEWVVKKNPTKTQEGLKKSSCKVCNIELTKSIPWIGSKGLKFELSTDGTYYTLVGMGTCKDTCVVIPSEYKGLPVTTIAYANYPNTIFADTVTSLYVPASITTIVDKGVIIGIRDVYIVDLKAWCNIQDRGAGYFSDDAYNLHFNGKLVTDLVIPEGVTTINNMAFFRCKSIKTVTIPSSVSYISSYAFSNCPNLKSIKVSPENSAYHSQDNCLIHTSTKTLVLGFDDSIIPKDGSVTTIGSNAFNYCKNLKSIDIPDSITIIDSGAFYQCTNLTIVTIPNSVISIGSQAFGNCTNLTSITIPDSVTSIDFDAFSQCTKLKNVTIGKGITNIGNGAFKDCINIEIITINGNPNSIGTYAFSNCHNVKSFIFNGTTSEWDAVTKNKGWNENCKFAVICSKAADGHTHTLGEWIVAKKATKSEDGQKTLSCSSCGEILGYEVIPLTGSAGLSYKLSSDGSFYSVSGIGSCKDSDMYIPTFHKGLPVRYIFEVRKGSFFTYENHTVTSIHISEGIERIGSYAFHAYYALKTVYIPSTVQQIDYGFITGANIESIIVDENSPYLRVVDNCLIDIKQKEIVYGYGDFSIPTDGSVTKIMEYAFANNEHLTNVVIPDGITCICLEAFIGCKNVLSIHLPASVVTVSSIPRYNLESITVDPNNTVYHCENNCLIKTENKTLVAGCKTSIIPNDGSVTKIGGEAFLGCSDLTSITIPNTITRIESFAFDGCVNLADVTFNGTIAQWNAITKDSFWNNSCPFTVIHCTDGDVSVS